MFPPILPLLRALPCCSLKCDLLLFPILISSLLLTCWWCMADTYEELRQAVISVLWGKGSPGFAAGGREIFQGFCQCWVAVWLPQLPLLILGSLVGITLESISQQTGLQKTENRINMAVRSDLSIFPHASDRSTYTWHDSCLQLTEPHNKGEGGGRTSWDKWWYICNNNVETLK